MGEKEYNKIRPNKKNLNLVSTHKFLRGAKYFNVNNNEIEFRYRLLDNLYILFKSTCNFANNIKLKNKKIKKSTNGFCPFGCPFDVLCIFADGSTSFCTLDYDNSINLGNIIHSSIEEIWNSKQIRDIRKDMQNSKLVLDICQQCQGHLEDY
jgi:radical SAM protein with 4Fe4S-binding SPASM domain